MESGHRLEMMTILDLTEIDEEKHGMARELAMKLSLVRHENVLNFLRPMRIEPTHVDNGLMVFVTEAPDHRLSWNEFCKLPFDLEQTVSIFRMLTAGVKAMHDSDLIFRDLHPSRIHLADGIVKWNSVGMP